MSSEREIEIDIETEGGGRFSGAYPFEFTATIVWHLQRLQVAPVNQNYRPHLNLHNQTTIYRESEHRWNASNIGARGLKIFKQQYNNHPTGGTTPKSAANTPTTHFTLIISILYSPLPQQITSELLQTLLVNNANSFVELLKYSDSEQLSSYFRTLDSIPQVLGVERVTLPPTLRPTDSPTSYVTEEVMDSEEGLGGATVAAVIFGLIYVALAICSMCYVKRARRRMKMERERKFVGGEQQPQSAGHGMVYEEEVKKKVGKHGHYDDENGELKKKSRKGRNRLGRSLLRGGLKGSLTKKNKVNDSNGVVADKANGQYEQQRYNDANYHNGGEDRGLLMDEENEGSYYSEDEEEEEEREDLSSMEDSYYSSGESEYSSEESYSEEE